MIDGRGEFDDVKLLSDAWAVDETGSICTDGHLIPYTQNTPGGIDWDNLLEGLKLVCAISRHFSNRLRQ